MARRRTTADRVVLDTHYCHRRERVQLAAAEHHRRIQFGLNAIEALLLSLYLVTEQLQGAVGAGSVEQIQRLGFGFSQGGRRLA